MARVRIHWNVPPETDAEKIARLERELERRDRQIEQLKEENQWLRRELEKVLRAAKRQAAPHSRGAPKENPKKPGRKAGSCYGRPHWRPKPQEVDETLEARLPEACPHCGGAVELDRVADQYQTDLPAVRPIQRRFRVELGHCRECGERLQARHGLQTSDALGVAGSQLGPQAVAWAVVLVKQLGLTHDKARTVLEQLTGLRASRSGWCQAIARASQKAAPTYEKLIQQLRRSPAATPDETSWKVGGRLWWLWAFATPELTVYSIEPGRGFVQAAAVLGEDYAGALTHDGWAVYEKFLRATHQTCLGHLDRRCKEMIALARTPAAARFPQEVRAILHAAWALRDRRAEAEISAHGLAVARGRLLARLERAWAPRFRLPENERLANHLYKNHDALFTFLDRPGLDATNWRAEQALRPLVVIRKVWGGNRTPAGARTQEILGSLLRTCWQQRRAPVAILQQLLCSPHAKPIRLLRRKRAPPAASGIVGKYRPLKAA